MAHDVTDTPIVALLVEDNPGDARLVREALVDAATTDIELVEVTSLSEALGHVAAGEVSVALLDLSLPDASGLETVARVRAAAPDVPILVLTGLSDEAVALEAVRIGAQDYLVKGAIDGGTLVRGIQHAMERHRKMTEIDETHRREIDFRDQQLSHVSHELRAPLNAIQGLVTLVLDELEGIVSPRQREFLAITLRNVSQLDGMISDLLDATRVETGKLVIDLRRVALGEAITDTLQSLREPAGEKGVTLSTDLPSALPDVEADPRRVRQILTNLVDNAIKFTPPRGTVEVRARTDDAAGFVRVTVVDTGCGISPQAQQRIFERLHQESVPPGGTRRGLGLGLYICEALVVQQGGRIWVESTPGLGSAFNITLPVFAAARATKRGAERAEGDPGDARTCARDDHADS